MEFLMLEACRMLPQGNKAHRVTGAVLLANRKVVCYEPSWANARNPARYVADQQKETEFNKECDLLYTTETESRRCPDKDVN